MDMRIARSPDRLIGEQLVHAFDFLEAENIRLERLEKMLDDADAQSHRVDIPGRQSKIHSIAPANRRDQHVAIADPAGKAKRPIVESLPGGLTFT
jgi:hypothetical protein